MLVEGRETVLHMNPETCHQRRAAVAVVPGIIQMLNVGRQRDSAPQARGVAGLENIFARSSALAQNQAEAA
jgi:hypothetical protein